MNKLFNTEPGKEETFLIIRTSFVSFDITRKCGRDYSLSLITMCIPMHGMDRREGKGVRSGRKIKKKFTYAANSSRNEGPKGKGTHDGWMNG